MTPIPKNIYGATKTAAETLCELFARRHGLPCLVLRTSRFFPEPDDDMALRGCRECGWRMFPSLDRVYVNARAREELGWQPRHDFATALARVAGGGDRRSELAQTVGVKGYHGERYRDGVYPVA